MKYKFINLEEVSSTNVFAKNLAEKGEREGTIIIAKRQTSGVGRFDRKWFSPLGGIYLSIILRPKILPKDMHKITSIASSSVSKAVEDICKIKPLLKEPNDLIIDDKKFCGILTEAKSKGEKIEYVILGIGVNVNIDKFPDELVDKATSIKCNREKLLELIIKNFNEFYSKLEKAH